MHTMRPFALDGHPEDADPVAQRDVLERLRELGLDTKAIVADLLQNEPLGSLRAQLLREQVVFAAADDTDQDRANIQGLSQDLCRLLSKAGRLNVSLPTEQLLATLDDLGARARGARSLEVRSPSELAEQRRRSAAPGLKELHHQIPAGAPEELVTRYFIPEVVCRIHAHLQQVAGPVLRQDAARAAEQTIPDDLNAEIQRRVSLTLNKLTADFVRAFFPRWAAMLRPPHVRDYVRGRIQPHRRHK